MGNLSQDVQFAFRQLRKTPGFAVTVFVTLALGIGANTAVFSVMNAVLLRMLPVRDPQQLVYLTHENMPNGVSDTGDSRLTYGINVYNRMRADKSAFTELIAYAPLAIGKTPVRFGDTPEGVQADEVSGNFFTGLGVAMAAGQPLQIADEEQHSAAAVLSYGYWSRRFDRDPAAIGKRLFINGVPFTIVGVAGPGFQGVESQGISTDLWIPLQTRAELPAWGFPPIHNSLYGSPNWWSLMLIARLKPGVAREQAVARMNPVFAHAAWETVGQETPRGNQKLELNLVSAQGLGTGSDTYRQPLRVLMGMVALVLVIACVNIVMLLLARNSVREREFALRMALGAGRGVIFRQLLAESALLVVAGSLLGWLFALEATRLLGYWSQLQVSLAPDGSVLVFTLAVATVCAVVFGLAPLGTAARAEIGLVLKSSGTQASASRASVSIGKLLLILQMAFCVVLLFASGLLLRTLRNYQTVDLGMRADRVLAVGIRPVGAGSYAQTLSFYRTLTERVGALPGVQSVTLASNRPGAGWSNNNDLTIDGNMFPFDDGKNMLRTNNVGPGFFKTLGIPIVGGRDILDSDTQSAPRVAVVNQTLAERYLKGASPIGHTLGVNHPYMIVGVVRDSKYAGSDERKMPMAWYSYQQSAAIEGMDVEIRTSGDPMAQLPGIRRIMQQMDPNVPLEKPELLQTSFESTYLMPALFARLAIFFALLAVLLVALGLYGTLSYRVNRRTLEIGVRMALGAARPQVLWMIVRESLTLVAAGLVIGLPLAWFTSRLMDSMLFELSVHDPFSFAAAGIGVLVVSVAAAVIPARRAASVEPIRALRME